MKKAAFSDPDLLPQILAVLPEGVLLCADEKHHHEVLYANDAAGRILSCPPAQMVGFSLRHCLLRHLKDAQIEEKLAQALTRQPSDIIQIENCGKDGMSWISLQMITLGAYFLCRIDTLGDQRINELRLSEAYKLEALGQLAGGVAHDFNNILSIIEGYARIAGKEVTDQPVIADYLDRIRQSVRRGAGLTQQLLAFGRKNGIREDTYDLGELITEYEALFAPLLDASITLQVDVARDVHIACAPDIISQILMNIIVNARDAMPEGGTINLDVAACPDIIPLANKTDEKGDYARIRVRDTGTGMDADTQRRIFDPFFTTKPQDKGTGLGMAMVYGYMQQMKGFIEVESVVGEGTTVSLYFPLCQQPKRYEIMRLDDGRGGHTIRMEGYTVLVAEDEPDLLFLVASMLDDMGMTVLTAANGNEALARQDEYDGQIDFLVTDVVMPEMNGVKLAQMFEAVRPTSKILFISGYPAVGTMAKVSLPEGAHLLSKPVAYDQLAYVLCDLAEDNAQAGLLHMAGEIMADAG